MSDATRDDVVVWTGAAFRERPNLVVPATRTDGTALVVKVTIGDPDDPLEYPSERDALRHYAALPRTPGVRAVRLLGCDDALRLLELEWLPGDTLDAGWPGARPDAELTAELARTMRSLWAAPGVGANWRPLALWMRALDRHLPGIDTALRERARDLGAELRRGAEEVVLHGDLHHENVLREADGDLVVIDPKGILGAPGFDVGALLWNPFGQVLDFPALTDDRLEVLAAELAMERAEVQAWGWVAAVLSAAWEAADGNDPSYPLAVADLIGLPR